MKKIYSCILLCLPIVVSGCSKEAEYTLKEKEIEVEVGTKDFDPIAYLLKDNKALTKEERKDVKTGAMIDAYELGDYTLNFPEYKLDLLIHVKDTQKPTLSLIEFRVKQGNVFTWNEETYANLKAQAKDNYDSGELLKKSLYCDSVDTSTVGKQTIACQIEDSSGNKTVENVTIEIVAGEVKEEGQKVEIPEKIEKPKPIEGFD